MLILTYTPSIRQTFGNMLVEYFTELEAGIPEDTIRGRLLDMFETLFALEHVHGAVAIKGRRMIGFVIYQIDSEQSDWCKRPGWGCIREFYIRPEFRNRGCGQRLAAFAERKLRKLGARQIYLTADTAKIFWEHCGYSNTHEICSNDLEIFTK